jgi:DNA segregation ATPase FtsK/SpoIIIE, S-DNA-T family
MRLAVTAESPATGRRADVVIDAGPAATVSETAAALDRMLHVETGGGPAALRLSIAQAAAGDSGTAVLLAAPTLFAGGQEIPGDMTLADSPIRDGSVISLGSLDRHRRPERPGIAEIRVASGPAAGTLHLLAYGQFDVGSGHASQHVDIVIADPAIPPLALQVQIDSQGCQVVPFPGVQILLDRRPLESAARWRPGKQITVGATLLDLAPHKRPDAALRPASDGSGLEFNRPPRLLPPGQADRFALPSPPGGPERRPFPLLTAVVPVVLGVALAYFLHQVYMLAIAAFGPVMLLGGYVSDRRHGRISHARQQAGYRDHKARIERDARAAVATERRRWRRDCPDPATVLSIATGPRRRLWERRRTDPDYLLLRVGTADQPSAVELTDPSADEHRRRVSWLITDAPATIPLAERAVVGIAGPGGEPRAAGRWLAAQIAALHSPDDVQLYVLTDLSGETGWEWTRWLPHCRPAEGQDCTALIGNDAETVAARIAELQALITARQKALTGHHAGRASFGRDIVVIFDGSRKMRSLPGAVQILREGGQAGVYCICLDADERLLPGECQAVAAARPDGTLSVQQMSQPAISQVRPEYVTPAWAELLARSIAPIRDVSGAGEDGGLPDACRLLDLLGLEPPSAQAIAGRWATAGRSTSAVIGAGWDAPLTVDLRKDGPHVLIGGTTGAGKSELLQTLIASLACGNRPDAMTFVLVDYKGGSAFKDCVSLPHVVGLVTDLDVHLTQRALASLAAELTRREQILAAAGVKDIEDYTALACRQGGDLGPLPRLVIVIDEFASLARDLPGFVAGLVDIAQRGRSLGIHLVLATQRPSGAVSADIRANTNLRIALRVTDAAESTDVIDAPDAAQISRATPGRAFVRLGHAALVPVQAARIGGLRPGAPDADGRPWLTAVPWTCVGRPEPRRPSPRYTGGEEEITDLRVLVTQIQQAAADMDIPAQHSPWLPALPPALLLEGLPAPAPPPARGTAALAGVPFGLEDLPRAQRQQPAVIRLDAFGHLMAAGAPQSGRSQLLRTIAASIAISCSTADAHIYGIDCGNGALLPVAELPQCGAVVTRGQAERATRLITRLGEELERRHDLLAEGGFAGITEQRAAAAQPGRLPHIIVLLDRWEGFTATFGEAGGESLTDVITRILGEGASAGIHLVMTGDRSLLSGRIGAMCEDKLAFRLTEKDDYALIGLRARDLPDNLPPGRAFRAGTGTETQVALLSPDPSGPGQAEALRQAAAQAARRDTGVPRPMRPFRVDALPARISFDDAWRLRPAGTEDTGLWGLAGVGGDELTALGADLSCGTPAFIVAGPARSGRSLILTSMTRSFLAGGAQVILVTPRPSPLRSLAALPGMARLFEQPDLGEDELASAIASLAGPAAVVIDDAEMLASCEAGGELAKIIAHGAARSLALVAAGDADALTAGFGGWHVDARRARRGCLTAPQSLSDGDLIGVRLTRAHLGSPVRPGRALLNTGDGKLITITVPAG